MAFKSYAKTLRPEGEYECILNICRQTETLRGDPVIEFDFLIRTDVDQACAGQHIYKRFFTENDGSWPEAKIGRYANALGVPDGEEYELHDLNGRCCTVVVKHFEKEDGTKAECIFYTKPSEIEQPKPLEVDDLETLTSDDIPF